MNRLMETLRENPPRSFAGQAVLRVKDYRSKSTTTFKEGTIMKDIDLPSSNVVQFFLADCSIITARPSGTEPKIKFYASCRSARGTALEDAMTQVGRKIDAITKQVNAIIEKA